MSTTIRIDNIKPGSIVTLDLAGDEHVARFEEIIGTGDERVARFTAKSGPCAEYAWDAYRFNGRWAFGTSAQRMSVISVEDAA
jgi:hypothetical protein